MAPAPLWFRYLAYLMAALFVVCVALQYNDPDPVRWMLIYGVAAVVSTALPRDRRVAPVALVLGLGAAVWAAFLVQSTWGAVGITDLTSKMSEQGGAVEVGREAGGLAIVAVWLVIGGALRWRRQPRQRGR
ncbi:MAG: transmembrane 220 family protein [Deltaproteobacteria bacterium]|nr:transmembrane 220 family protein [Deltaproteobacteria bacterium]